MTGVLPNVTRIAEHAPDRTLFSICFISRHPEEMQGAWQDYPIVNGGDDARNADPRLLELPATARASARPPASWKDHYSGVRTRALHPPCKVAELKR